MTEPRTAQAAEKPCELYAHNAPPIPSRTQGHHRYPMYLQRRVWGEVRDGTLAYLCGLCHDSVHDVIGWQLGETRRPEPMPGRNVLREAQRTVDWYRAALADKEGPP